MLITLLSIAPVFFVAEFSATLYIVLGLVAGSLLLTHTAVSYTHLTLPTKRIV